MSGGKKSSKGSGRKKINKRPGAPRALTGSVRKKAADRDF